MDTNSPSLPPSTNGSLLPQSLLLAMADPTVTPEMIIGWTLRTLQGNYIELMKISHPASSAMSRALERGIEMRAWTEEAKKVGEAIKASHKGIVVPSPGTVIH